MSTAQGQMSQDESPANPTKTEMRYVHSSNLSDFLSQLGISLLISTYQAGKLVVVGTHNDQIAFSFHSFEQIMGIAPSKNRIAIGTRRQIFFLPRADGLGERIEPAKMYDECYLARLAHLTGPIQIHEMAWGKDELWIVNTLFSCLCTLDRETSFVPRWKPHFISSLADEDRCHLNSLAMLNGVPTYVTALGESNTRAGWRPQKATGGIFIDVASGEIIARNLSMPHSARVYDGKPWVLDSGNGRLCIVDLKSGKLETVAQLPGYARGLTFLGPFAFVGQSRIRETNIFGGLPICARWESLECGVSVIDIRTGSRIAHLTLESGVEEIFDVQILPGVRMPAIGGPNQEDDGQKVIWLAAPPRFDSFG